MDLRRQRLLRGWSLEDLAQAVIEVGQNNGEHNLALTAKTVGRWERGETNPRPPYPKLLCKVFQLTAQQLGLQVADHVRDRQRAHPVRPLAFEPDRGASFSFGGGLISPIIANSTGLFSGGPPPVPVTIDHSSLCVISQALRPLRRLAGQLGSNSAMMPAFHLRSLVEHIKRYDLDEEVRIILCSVSAELCQFLGWLAYDLGDRTSARAYYQDGLRYADRSGNRDLLAFLLGNIALLALAEGKVHEAESIVSTEFPFLLASIQQQTLSWFMGVEARVRAISGMPAECHRALAAAAAAFKEAGTAASLPWLYFLDEAELSALEGECLEQIGVLDQARRRLESAVGRLASSRVLDGARCRIHLARVCARLGAIEEACEFATEAWLFATQTGSQRLKKSVDWLREELEPWRETAAVKNLDRIRQGQVEYVPAMASLL